MIHHNLNLKKTIKKKNHNCCSRRQSGGFRRLILEDMVTVTPSPATPISPKIQHPTPISPLPSLHPRGVHRLTRGDWRYTSSDSRACFVRLSAFNCVAPNGVLLLANSSQEISCAKLVFGLPQRMVRLDIMASVRIAPLFD